MADQITRVAWITGAGSGMGRASARRLALSGFAVALSGRREDALDGVAREIRSEGGTAVAAPLDVTDTASIAACHDHIVAELGTVTDLVLSAGLNDPQRSWRDQSLESVNAIVATNLLGPVGAVQAVLPGMRERGEGTIVFISSYSGWRFSPDAGVAYSASKTALSSLSETLNAQENAHGVRACNLCPGDVDSDFLSMRPSVPDAVARQSMLSPDDVAASVAFVIESPATVCVNELVVTPVKKRG